MKKSKVGKKKRRNHFIPRFLLNRFASRIEGKKYWVWQVAHTGSPIEISTRDAAVTPYFYGTPDSGVEDAFATVETRFGQTLIAIDAGDSPQAHSEDLRQYVWTLAVRTRALREQLIATTDRFLTGFAEFAYTQKARHALTRQLESAVDDQINEMFSKIPYPQGIVAKRLFRQLAIKQARALDPALLLTDFVNILRQQDILGKAGSRGHVQALAALLKSRGAPDSFKPSCWQVLSAPSGIFVLGDACIFAISEDNSCGSLLRFSQTWRELYFPISTSQVIIAKHDTSPPLLDLIDINRASFMLAFSHIYASRMTSDIQNLSTYIGKAEPILSKKEMQGVIEESWNSPAPDDKS